MPINNKKFRDYLRDIIKSEYALSPFDENELKKIIHTTDYAKIKKILVDNLFDNDPNECKDKQDSVLFDKIQQCIKFCTRNM